MSAPIKSCLVMSDGRRGIENQALGLAHAASEISPLDILAHHLTSKELFKAATPAMQLKLKPSPTDYGLSDHAPEIAIGCGRQAVAPLRALKEMHGDAVFTVYIQDPRVDPRYFDLVIVPEHDSLRANNVEVMIGSPNRVTRELIVGETLTFADRLSALPMPRIAALIGGPSKAHRMSKPGHAEHIKMLRAVIEQGYSLLLTTSRRTPDWAQRDYRLLASDFDTVWLHDGQDSHSPNPYFAFLGGAEAILVTEESTNMLTEACATGKPVFRLPMDGRAGNKFETLYQALDERCGVKAFTGNLDAPDYAPLNETARVAEQLWAHFHARGVAFN